MDDRRLRRCRRTESAAENSVEPSSGSASSVPELADEKILIGLIRLMPWKLPTERTSAGRSRLSLAIANVSPPTPRGDSTRAPLVPGAYPPFIWRITERCAGNSFVRMSTSAPAKSPCWSGVKVLSV